VALPGREPFGDVGLLGADPLEQPLGDRQDRLAAQLVVGVDQVGRAGGVDRDRVEGQAQRVDRPQPGLDQDDPPWTEPKGGPPSTGELWAKRRKLPIGDRSPSQLFLWRALDFLAPSGVAAILVSAKVLFNTRTTSRTFRQRWLREIRLGHVINFSDVRHDFFERAVAPFALLRFGHPDEEDRMPFVYETARAVPSGRRGSVALARLDRRVVDQRSLLAEDFLWKTYSAGDHRDHALIARLDE